MADDDDAGQQDNDNTTGSGNGDGGKTFSQVDLDRIVADRVARERAKYADYADLKRFKASAMTDAEKAVADAEARGKASALTESGQRLARAELKAAAVAAGVDKATLDGFLEFADLKRFVGDDGEPDSKAIASAVKKLGGDRPANFDGGARTTAAGKTDMNALIRQAAGLG